MFLGALLLEMTLFGMMSYQIQGDTVESARFVEHPGYLIGQLVIFLTTLAGIITAIYRENRNRRWDKEDRAAAREEQNRKIEATARNVASEALHVAEELAHHADVQQREILDKVQASADVSERTFKEANAFNQKLYNITAQFTSATVAEVLGEIDATTKETHDAVVVIKDVVAGVEPDDGHAKDRS